MKVKCVVACNGIGYEDFNVNEERNLSDNLAKVLIEFGYVVALENDSLNDENREAGATGGIVDNAGALLGEESTETLITNVETEEEKRVRLIAKAKELQIKGVLENFKIETLEKKIAEAEATI